MKAWLILGFMNFGLELQPFSSIAVVAIAAAAFIISRLDRSIISGADRREEADTDPDEKQPTRPFHAQAWAARFEEKWFK